MAHDDSVLLRIGVGSQNGTYAVKAQSTKALRIQAIHIMTNGTGGFLEIWNHSAAKDMPEQRVAGK